MKNKLFVLLMAALALVLVFALASCGGDENTDTETNTETGTETETDTDTETEHVHKEEVIPAVTPTCTKQGLTEGKKCSECGEILVEQTVVDALDHSYEGSYNCTRCDFIMETSTGLEYNFDSNKATCYVIGVGSCTDESIVIPYEHEGATVVGIAGQAFYYVENLKSLTIPDSVTMIEEGALAVNINLEKIVVGKGNQSYKEIDGSLYTKNGETLVQYACGKKDTKFVLPKGVKTIAPYALYGVMCLESIDFGTELTTISDYAVATCPSLKTIVIPEQVEYIGMFAFFYSTGANSLVLKAKDVTIGELAFGHCFRLVEVYNLSDIDLTSYMDEESKISCKITEHTSLDEESVIKIEGDFAFVEKDSNVYLVDYLGTDTDVVLPESYQGKSYMINKGAFYFNSIIESVVIPNGVTGVGEQVFQECKSLKRIEVADSVAVLGDRAFCVDTSLERIIISNNATSINLRAFDGCEKVTAFVKGENQSNAIDILLANKVSAVYYFSEIEPTEEGNYWHYVDGEVTIWE